MKNNNITLSQVLQSNRKISHCHNSSTVQQKNITLSQQFNSPIEKYHTVKQFHSPIEKYHTVTTVPQSNRKIPHCHNSSTVQQKNVTLSQQFHSPIEKYHTVTTVPQSNRKHLSRGQSDTPTTQMHDCSLNQVVWGLMTLGTYDAVLMFFPFVVLL